MLNRFNQILMIIFILSVIGAAVLWFVSRPPSMDFAPILPADVNDQQSPDLDNVISEAPVDTDTSDVAEIFKTVFTEEEQAQPLFQQFMKVIESPKYTTFLETEPETLGDFFDYFASQGIPVDKDEMLNVFLELAPVGTREQLEERARVTLSVRFQQMPYNIRSREGMQAFQSIVEEFLTDEQNTAWMMTHFNGNFMEFGNWTVDVFRNPIRDMPDPSEFVEAETPTRPPQRSEQPTPVAEKETVSNQQQRTNQQPTETTDIDDPKSLTEVESPVLPEQDIETLFRQQFAEEDFTKEQLHRGMQYLLIFGEEKGLEQLKVYDPEMATHLEHLIRQRKKEVIPK